MASCSSGVMIETAQTMTCIGLRCGRRDCNKDISLYRFADNYDYRLKAVFHLDKGKPFLLDLEKLGKINQFSIEDDKGIIIVVSRVEDTESLPSRLVINMASL